MINLKTTQQKIEYSLASLLLERLSSGKIDQKRVSEIAKYILKVLPEKITEPELKPILEKLMADCPEIADACLNYYNEIESKETQTKIKEIQKKIKGYLYERTDSFGSISKNNRNP